MHRRVRQARVDSGADDRAAALLSALAPAKGAARPPAQFLLRPSPEESPIRRRCLPTLATKHASQDTRRKQQWRWRT